MLFDDIFYPSNPERREEVRTLQNAMLITLDQFRDRWNELTVQINPIFAGLPDQDASWRYSFLTLSYNTKIDSLNTCLERINSVASDAKHKVEKLIVDIGLETTLPADWHLDESFLHKVQDKIIKGLNVALPVVVSAVVGLAVKSSIQLIALWAQLSTIRAFALSYGGALIFSTVAFIATDAVVSAITGAIERNELESAIAVLKEADHKVREPLSASAVKISAVSMQFKDGSFRLDATHLLFRKKNDSWVVLVVPED